MVAREDNITLRLARAEDARAMARCSLAALAMNPVSRGFYGPAGTSDAAEASVKHDLEATLQPATRDPHVTYVVAELSANSDRASTKDMIEDNQGAASADASIDKDTNAPRVVGFVKWHFYSTKEASAAFVAPNMDTSDQLRYTFFVTNHEMRQRNIGGRPCAIITLLAIDPMYQRNGIGSRLVEWGIEKADADGLDCWLICTPAAHRLYRKCGYYDVDLMDIDLRKLAGVEKLHPEEDWGEGLAHDIRGPPPSGHYRAVLLRRKAKEPITKNVPKTAET